MTTHEIAAYLGAIFGACVIAALATLVIGLWAISRLGTTRDELEGVEIEGGMVFDEVPHPDVLAMSQAEAEARGLV